MSANVVELFKKASDLSEKDRATLAGLLIESLESERENDMEAAWIKKQNGASRNWILAQSKRFPGKKLR